MIYHYLRPLLFKLDPEIAQVLVLKCLKLVSCSWIINRRLASFPQQPTSVFGICFPNPVGLAAGLDKNGDYIDSLLGLGFGFIEVGTVTPKFQSGNPKPRLFRLLEAQALINRLGFNNLGVDHLVRQLKKHKVKGIIGANIGKNLTTPLEKAGEDYRCCLEKVYPYVDYVTINISSPNTPGLLELQNERYLVNLLNDLKEEQRRLEKYHQKRVPLLLKISPDVTTSEIKTIALLALEYCIEGIVATNTTTSHKNIEGLPYSDETGGISGRPLFSMTLKIVTQLHNLLGDKIPIIAVGGINSGEDASTLLAAGARLVALYTGLIYEGPELVQSVIGFLKKRL
ncbi:quinone-dependent dihydroorotate dehydrogenase [Coxiella endosymbiont of Amblyomma nuttalli]|uniref:quinone-dependent dihydroorotate dehydrogenase n=1 Tax=Coxiella endosymbiont of Amblyomma nuttalli TaxID=2749996 RepID=UPI001BAC1495|nr:quinone-dependent dihydroorotate dehydrogenase [Coxiella endosymbiont of Amblyomma nuttalli]